jgi:SIR2-like domain/Domain of unknown function (DUF4020)
MIFANVRLPDDIRIALEEEKLVVFVGAGISVPPPSKLPSFNGLAEEICGKPVPLGKEDQELGKLVDKRTDVHAYAAKRLFNSQTRPTVAHTQILRIFGTPAKVRIVTTNFDNHFSDAAGKIFGTGKVREFHAPALPLGDNFNGVVYLHGSARVNPYDMVLTDTNFGEAYLTRGWAKDFLIYLFQEYTVLFVGYSHNDVTISYLARGLNKDGMKRWALVPSNLKSEEKDNWDRLQIKIQQYPYDPDNKDNQHQALTDFLMGWGKYAKESILDRSKKVKSIAIGLPPESESVSEYLDYCLKHPQLAQDFCNSIRHPAWIGWLEAKGYFNVFFKLNTTPFQGYENVLAHWLSTFVRREYPELLLEIFYKNQQRFVPAFSAVFCHAVWTDKKTLDPHFATWVSLLLDQGENAVSGEMWAYLLQDCKIPEHTGIAMRIVELITIPQLRLKHHFDFSGLLEGEKKKAKKISQQTVDYEIAWPQHASHWLNEAWEKILKPHINELAEPLVLIVTKQLTLAYLLLRDAPRGKTTFDILSWHRNSIASHGQNRSDFNECLSFLVDAAREVLVHWFNTNPARAHAQLEAWWSTDFQLLERIAVFGISLDPTLSNDEKIKWLLENDLIFGIRMKKEVFDVLKTAYPGASPPVRKRLIKRVDRGYSGKLKKKLGETAVYEKFNVFVWLKKADEKCQFVRAAIEKIQKEHPNFGEREHPDFDSWMEGAHFIDPKEGFNFEKILSEPPYNFLNDLKTSAANSVRKDRYSYLSNLQILFTRNLGWGFGFMEELAKDGEANSEIWSAAFWAWREIIKTKENWFQILKVIEQLPEQRSVYSGVANLISNCLFKGEVKSDESILAQAAVLMEKAWDICGKVEETPDDSFRDWLASAINHEGGWIGEFWIHYCSYLRQQAGTDWKGIPDDLKARMQSALKGKTRVKVFARIVMTQWMAYIFAWDKNFAVENFLPLLDWKKDAIVAQQTWSVLLNYRQGTFAEVEKELIPYYQQFASMLKNATEKTDQFDDQTLRHLGHYLAGLAIWIVPNPVQSGFFRDFLPPLPENVRIAMARGIGDFLEKCPPDKIEQTWDTWLKEYIDLRLMGVPVALSNGEATAMLDWCLYLADHFPEAIERIVQMQFKGAHSFTIIHKLVKPPFDSFLEKFPKESCRYIVAILKAEEYPFLDEKHSQLYDKLKTKILGTPDLDELEKVLYLRGWKK